MSHLQGVEGGAVISALLMGGYHGPTPPLASVLPVHPLISQHQTIQIVPSLQHCTKEGPKAKWQDNTVP